jgi:hypothetical protein
MSLYQFLKKKKKFYLVLLAFSVFFIVISFSRTALISIAAGLLYLFFFNKDFFKYKKMAILLFVLAVVIFLFEGASKSIFDHVIYYIQSMYAFYKHPFGIGMGNFGELFDFRMRGTTNSIYTHSLPLEVLAGTGIFGVPFFIWLYKVIKDVFFVRKNGGLIYRLMALVLLIDFTFNMAYMIALMFWILFMSLGLAQSYNDNTKNRSL